jgi:hypothetical protein
MSMMIDVDVAMFDAVVSEVMTVSTRYDVDDVDGY